MNRIDEIHKTLSNAIWRSNPSVLITRGITGKNYTNSELWFHGPEWLARNSVWPVWDTGNIDNEEILAGYATNEVAHVDKIAHIEPFIKIDNFNSFKKLFKATILTFRFVSLLRKKKPLIKMTGLSNEVSHQFTKEQWPHVEDYWIQEFKFNLNSFKRKLMNCSSKEDLIPVIS
ncbi:unnamed protein product [Rotaria magnacalcarata]|uniref:Uncharacterized protein n=1 Tax=Rotaria magnacalcarata TaxID=392030 RepID=A0A817B2P9_9BILA|nr:unnamed protein product [Rotaria magnacalcarata]